MIKIKWKRKKQCLIIKQKLKKMLNIPTRKKKNAKGYAKYHEKLREYYNWKNNE
jgi:hypothetical protein